MDKNSIPLQLISEPFLNFAIAIPGSNKSILNMSC